MLPNNIASYRNTAGFTQERLAELIGTTRDYVAKLETNKKKLMPEWLEKIGAALGVEPYLLIAPDRFLPTEAELGQLIAAAQQKLPAGLPYSEWPQAVAGELHTRLRTLAGDRSRSGIAD